MSSQEQLRSGDHYSQEQVDFVVNAKGTYQQVAEDFNTRFNTRITRSGIRYILQSHGLCEGTYKWTLEQIEFVLNANGTRQQIADAYKANFNTEISIRSLDHIKVRYGPGTTSMISSKYTKDQIQFVLDASGTFSGIADDYNARFNPTPKIKARSIIHIKERYGPGLSLP